MKAVSEPPTPAATRFISAADSPLASGTTPAKLPPWQFEEKTLTRCTTVFIMGNPTVQFSRHDRARGSRNVVGWLTETSPRYQLLLSDQRKADERERDAESV